MMQKYGLRVSYLVDGAERSVTIRTNGADDDEMVRTSHVLADILEYQGVAKLRIDVIGDDNRDVATLGPLDEVTYLDRPVKYGAGFRKS